MEPKAKTLQERFGFSDPDLKTPKHDAIMLWLDGEIRNVLATAFSPEWVLDWGTSSPLSIQGTARSLMARMAVDMRQQILESLNLPAQPGRTIWAKWESPIMDRTFTIGFADMQVKWRDERVYCDFSVSYPKEEVTYLSSSLSSGQGDERVAYFEVKPSVPSVGELIRQLRMYQTYTGNAKWFVVSPDARFRSVIEGQGFGFVLVPEGVE